LFFEGSILQYKSIYDGLKEGADEHKVDINKIHTIKIESNTAEDEANQIRLLQKNLFKAMKIWVDVLEDMLAMVRAKISAKQLRGETPGALAGLETGLKDRLEKQVRKAVEDVDQIVDPEKLARMEKERKQRAAAADAASRAKEERDRKEKEEKEKREKEEADRAAQDAEFQSILKIKEARRLELADGYMRARSSAGLPW